MKMNKLALLTSLFCLSMTACTGGNNSINTTEPQKSEPSSVEPEPEKHINVFVLTGQSNMEGNTRFSESNLKQVFADLNIEDADDVFGEGIPEVQTSFYGCGYGQIYTESNVHASNNEAGHKIDGKFLNTKVGMGNSDSSIGPELGAAYVLRNEIDSEYPVYFIKCGISGSGFAQNDSQGDKINWNVEKDENLYVNILKPYTQNCLNLIEEATGEKPIIKGFLWNQGESDADPKKYPVYNDRFDALVGQFKEDFGEYAPDEDGENIAVIDALIYEKNKPETQAINDEKLKNVERHDNYYYVDATEREGGMALTMGGDNLHYDLKSMVRLGMAYGQAILDNGLLDF